MEIRFTNETTDEVRIFDTEELKRLYREGNKIYVETKDGRKIWVDETADETETRRYVRSVGQTIRLFKPEAEIRNSAALVELCADIGMRLREMVKNAGHQSNSDGQ